MRFVAGRGHYETVIQAVQSARVSVWIATANLKELMIEDTRWSVTRRRRRGATAYRSVIDVFDELVTAGVEIRLLHAGVPSRPFREELARHASLGGANGSRRRPPSNGIAVQRGKSDVTARRDNAVIAVARDNNAVRGSNSPGQFEMRLCPRVHLKAVIVDGAFLYLGSANWTGAGLGAKGTGRRNFELGIVTDDAPLLDDVQEIFDKIWRGTECSACKLRDECPAPIDGTKTVALPARLRRSAKFAR
jgi:phosphatidylserine/phosphatidylglycerophosphate/cardiolipin synthase-like enzyme